MPQPENTPQENENSPGATPASADQGAAASPLAGASFKKEVVKGLTLGTFGAADYEKMEAFARAEGVDVNSAMRHLLLRALTELKPNIPEAAQAIADVKGTWKTVMINKQPRERFYLQIELKKSHQTLVDAWNVLLPALQDRHQVGLLAIVNDKVPMCFYENNPRLPSMLHALGIETNALPLLENHALDTIGSMDLQDGKVPPKVRLLAPEQVLAVINRSTTFFASMKEPIAAARAKYGGNFAGIDQSKETGCISLNPEQISLIDRLKETCERLVRKSRA